MGAELAEGLAPIERTAARDRAEHDKAVRAQRRASAEGVAVRAVPG